MGSEEGERAALLREHVDVLARVAMALVGDAAQVERILEQVAREAGAGAPPEGTAPRSWLLGLVRAASATHLSRIPLRTRTQSPGEAPETPAGRARRALATLKPTEREAVVLSLVGGLDVADVARACNVAVETAKSRLTSGLEQLRREGEKS